MDNKVLITGGAGFIGSHLVDMLLKEGIIIKVVDNLSTGQISNISSHKNNRNIHIMIGDLKNPQVCMKAVKEIDTVFHFAANPEVRVSTTNPKIHFEENVIATFNILEAMRRNDINKLIFASSSSVYGEPKSIPVDENAPIKPHSVYGASKAASENLIYSYSKLYGIKTIILRYANVVGPRLRHGIIYDLLMKLKKDRDKLEVLGDGTQTRSYVYISDAIEATIMLYKKRLNGFDVYNIASEDWITVKDVVKRILEILGLTNTRIVYKPILEGVGWPGDIKRIALDISKIKKIGFKPKLNSYESITKTIRHLSKELDIYPFS